MGKTLVTQQARSSWQLDRRSFRVRATVTIPFDIGYIAEAERRQIREAERKQVGDVYVAEHTSIMEECFDTPITHSALVKGIDLGT